VLTTVKMMWTTKLLLLAVLLPLSVKAAGSEPAVTVHGGAGEVSGSLSIVDAGPFRVMVDCGAYYPDGPGTAQERQERAASRNSELPADATECRFLVWTHAHLDHLGRTPLLVQRGFRGTILTTTGTAAIAPVMLEMQVRYDAERIRDWVWSEAAIRRNRTGSTLTAHWRPDCKWAAKISPHNGRSFGGNLLQLEKHVARMQGTECDVSPCKVCGEIEVDAIMALVVAHPYEREVPLGDGVYARFTDAGHIPGSASLLLTMPSNLGQRRVLFSGDLGSAMSRVAPGPACGPAADLVVVESTYGDIVRAPELAGEFLRFRQDVARTVGAGGVAWIPAFALDRTQKILWELRTAQLDGTLDPQVPIYCPSPSGNEITAIYSAHRSDGWFSPAVANDPQAFSPFGLQEQLPRGLPAGPAIVVSTSGMMETAFAGQLAPLLENPRNGVFLVGYQDPFTPGGELKQGVRKVAIDGRFYQLAATVSDYGCFSGHADAADVVTWLASQAQGTRVLLVHGDPERLAARARMLEGRLQASVAQRGVRVGIR
jgi:metallo-beta-lactamase family protein